MTKKISQLPAATSVDTNDEFVINQDGTTKKLTTANPWQFSNVNIDGGSIDGTAIGASSASSGAFTTLMASGDVNFDSGTLFVDASANALGAGITTPSGQFHVSSTDIDLYLTGTRGSGNTYSIKSSGANAQDIQLYDETASQRLSLHATDIHAWYIGGSEKARIDSSGHAIIPAGVTLGTSAGVFNAANTLDDYEVGVYVPTLAPSTSGSITAASNHNSLRYVVIGKTCFVHGRLEIGSVSSPLGSIINITLPFAIASSDDSSGFFGGAVAVSPDGSVTWQTAGLFSYNIGPSVQGLYYDSSLVDSSHRLQFNFFYEIS